ncbi:hypothetical protein [Xanthomonas nasturtii]|uniref:Uncharacterized protein n=1 Tax=Xanthomonas nasturtii TaxID=1843581 RepID=A0ABT0LKJ9_9XANT|nr:hypothetical protein [Xanthomonas nasturtii]MCL1497749.1 hypothetical protein [Xanthomonas nasturtii]MCL1502488.1 hypothetical protein [Xanthomonas nasturtii]MCL1522299.1 hypothetical protein [Xanthomonas nasturtii]MCL1525600.1 hypothetical protein [Xanthomonas nasturtii]MCL1529238.1 hypothetical protein [Xanthomonas nasturtii]
MEETLHEIRLLWRAPKLKATTRVVPAVSMNLKNRGRFFVHRVHHRNKHARVEQMHCAPSLAVFF